MSIIVGQAVRYNDFWNRSDELEDIWDAIQSGSHLLISAPRRVGKTSIMYKVLDEPKAHYIPVYINTESADSQKEFWHKLLIAQELKRLHRKSPIITPQIIDQAIENSLQHKQYFETWQSKIKTAFNKTDYLFAKEVLNIISNNITMKSLEIANIVAKHSLNDNDAKEIIHALIYDGYINNNDNPREYRFNSPILRLWWNKNVAN